MAKYVYPAVFTKEENHYLVNFPDIKNCYTDGESIAEAFEMAEDVLALMIYGLEERNAPIPPATDIQSISVNNSDSFVSLVPCDTFEYRKMNEKKSVKKTLSIPQWLNTMAEENGINFSQVLQKALKAELNLNNA